MIRNAVRLTDLPALDLARCAFWAFLALFLSTMVLSHVSKMRLATDEDNAPALAAVDDDDATDCGDFIAEKESPAASSPLSTQKSSWDGWLVLLLGSSGCCCLAGCCGVWGDGIVLDSTSFSCSRCCCA